MISDTPAADIMEVVVSSLLITMRYANSSPSIVRENQSEVGKKIARQSKNRVSQDTVAMEIRTQFDVSSKISRFSELFEKIYWKSSI